MSNWLQNVYYFVLGSLLLLCSSAFAINGRTTYQAKIYKPDGLPLEAVSVNFRFSVLDPSSSCVLYVEDYAAVNMIGSGGLTSFSLGMGTRTYPASGPVTFASVFDNSVPSFVCQVPGVYNPVSTDNRKIVMQFNEGTGWQTLPAMAINSVPYAMYSAKAQNAQQLNGKADTAFVEYSTLAALNCQANEAIKFNGVSFSCIAVGVGSSGISSVTTSGTVLSTGGTASAPVISIQAATMSQDGYLTSLDYAEFKAKLSASSTQIVNTLGFAPVSGAAVNSQIQASQLSGDVSGIVSANIVQSVGGKTAAQVSTSVNDTLAATSSATADTIVKRNSSGNITVNDIYANSSKINYVDIYKPSTSFNIRLQAPTSLAANYTLALPTTSGSVGQVLSTDGSGNLSWINPSTGSVTSVSATAPLSSTGGATPTISISQATSSTNGYLSSADWNTFNNKQQATSAAIIATLGYTPANATSATQWTTNGSHIYYSTGNVGIGVSNPVHPLDVLGQLRAGSATGGSVAMGNDGNAFVELREYDGAGTPYMDFVNDPSIDFDFRFILEGDDNLTMKGGNVGIGVFAQSALLHLGAGSATNGPLRFVSGTLLTSPLSGTMEYDGSNFYLTDGTNQRRAIATGSSQGSIDNASQINSTGNMTLNPVGSVIVSSTAASTDANTGALIVKGGLGVAGTTNIGGNLNVSGSSVIDGSLRLSSMTSGSVLFAGANGTVTQDNANFYWDGGNRRLGIGTSTPATKLDIRDTAPTIRLQETTTGGDKRLELGVTLAGLAWIGANQSAQDLAFQTVGTEKVRITSTGNVGIGTTTPSFPLSVSGTIQGRGIGYFTQSSPVNSLAIDATSSTLHSIYTNAPSVDLSLGTNNSTSQLYLKNNGNVGIGTTAPAGKLEVRLNNSLYNQVVNRQSDLSDAVYLTTNSQPHKTGLFLRGSDNIGAGIISAREDNGITWRTYLAFHTNNQTGVNTDAIQEKMRITSDGNVGIGATTPDQLLDVRGNISMGRRGQIAMTRYFGLAGSDGTFTSTPGGAGTTGLLLNQTASGDTSLQFKTGQWGVSEDIRMTVARDGNVGIGTTSPAAKLHVDGSIMVGTPSASFTTSVGVPANNPGGHNAVMVPTNISFGSGGANMTYKAVRNGANTFNDEYITFATHEGGVSIGERMRITPSGNVGIGTTNPSDKLHVIGGSTVTSGTGNISLVPDYLGSGYIQSYQSVGVFRPLKIDGLGVSFDAKGGNFSFLSGNVGIGTATPSYKLQVNGTAAIGDAVAGNSDASLTPLINHYLGGTGDSGSGSVAYILLAYNQTAASGITASGFDGQIYSYRGTAGTWNNATRMDIALKTAYDAPAVHRFSVDGPLANANVVTLTYSGTSYIGVQVPAASAMDYYITGRFWGFKPILLDSVNHGASISAVTVVSKPLIATVGGNVGIGTGNPQSLLDVRGMGDFTQIALNSYFSGGTWTQMNAGYGALLQSDSNFPLSIWYTPSSAPAGASNPMPNRAMVINSSGNVGIGTTTPDAKLEVAGTFIRTIAHASGNASDALDSGQIVSRVLNVTKLKPGTSLRIGWTDSRRTLNGGCRWEIRVDGVSCPGGALVYDYHSTASSDPHVSSHIAGYCDGVSAGAHQVQIWVSSTPGYTAIDCFTGWSGSRWMLESEEVN